MPIYEYSCGGCGEKFEVLHRGQMSDKADEQTTCPACGSGDVQRLLSTFSARVAAKMPACEGSTPSCSQSRCRSGKCPMSEF